MEQKKKSLKFDLKNSDFDVLKYHESKSKKSGIRTDLILIGSIFFITLLFSAPINSYLTVKYKYGQFGIYFLLILLGFVFTKRSKK